MLDKGVLCCVNCDNTLLSGTAGSQANPTGELKHLADDVLRANGLDDCEVEDAVRKVLLNGVEASFIWKVGGDSAERKEVRMRKSRSDEQRRHDFCASTTPI